MLVSGSKWHACLGVFCVIFCCDSIHAAEPPSSRPASTQPAVIKPLEIGSPAPDFDLPGVDGRRYGLKDFADAKVLAIVFTCNHCPTAQAYEERIKQLAADYKEKGVAVLAISPNDPLALRPDELGYTDLNDSFEEMKIRAEEEEFNFPYLYDGDKQDVSKAYGPASTPTLFIFDHERKLRYVGRIDDSEREDRIKNHDARHALDALLANKPVAKARTQTLGCSTKWSDKRDSVVKYMKGLAEEPVKVDLVDRSGIEAIMANKTDHLRLVNVWALSCAPCIIEFPELVNIYQWYRGRGLEFVSIGSDYPEQKDKVLAFLKKKQASNRNLLFAADSRYELAEAISKDWTGALPYTVLIAPGGKIVFEKQGPIDPLELRREIIRQLGRRE